MGLVWRVIDYCICKTAIKLVWYLKEMLKINLIKILSTKIQLWEENKWARECKKIIQSKKSLTWKSIKILKICNKLKTTQILIKP